ncbi:ankyrin repeat domain-containing protein 9 [Lampris incognitus]|uniref:ankyrin repeat domain-containing protein 9 n=1 Tax=Lampris incognitus TaxID=2546036 RepID=UPI0024B61CCD|nr:ankyrin repeat domain-containing protein 9 [Lampris incognitus]
MPWDTQQFDRRADYKSETQCQRTSFAFYRAVRDLLPVWALEDMRTMEVFHWEDDGQARAFTPPEALLYALVHDHQQYARYLLHRFSVRALAQPSRSFRCCQAARTPHLSVAVRYNRSGILRLILESAEDFLVGERKDFLDGRGGCAHDAGGGKTAVHLACDLARPECLLLLLAHGACPYVGDRAGDTPLDCLLRHVRQGSADMRRTHVCLGYLLLFMPKVRYRCKEQLQDKPDLWRSLLGEEAFRWLAGLAPPSLFIQAMQTVARTVPAQQLDALPDFLKPLDFRLQHK